MTTIKTVSIHQPNFMPWLGYFNKIHKSDIFILLDDAQFQKTGANYTNRVSINANGKGGFLTIPVKRDSGVRKINETYMVDTRWKRKAVASLQAYYAKALFFKQHKEVVFDLIGFDTVNLAEFNTHFIKEICPHLGIFTEIYLSSSFDVTSLSTHRLIELIKAVGGQRYISGAGGKNYQDAKLYKKADIDLVFNDMPHVEYPQQKTNEFISGLSIIDAIFNIGFDGLKERLFHV